MSEKPEQKKGWFQRLTSGLARSSQAMTEQVTGAFTKKPLDQEQLDQLDAVDVRHDDVDDERVDLVVGQQVESFAGIARVQGAVSAGVEGAPDQRMSEFRVVDDEHGVHFDPPPRGA